MFEPEGRVCSATRSSRYYSASSSTRTKRSWKRQIPKDIVSGVMVAVVALPLSIALGIASGVSPEQGLYTAIVAGFLIAFLGGSRVQISGPTAAFAAIVAGIVATDGMDGLVAATVIAGVLLMLMGFFKLGAIIRFVPYTITTGFTAGIAVTLVIGQMKDFLGLTFRGRADGRDDGQAFGDGAKHRHGELAGVRRGGGVLGRFVLVAAPGPSLVARGLDDARAHPGFFWSRFSWAWRLCAGWV